MGFRKTLISILIVFSLFPVCAENFSNTLTYDFSLPEQSHIVLDTAEWNFKIKDNFYLGPYFGLGYSVRHFIDYGSNALVYGPAFKMGLEAQYRLSEHIFMLAGGIKTAYSQFPTILWGNLDVCYIYKVGKRIGFEGKLGLMIVNKKLSFDFGLGLRYSL